LQKHRPSFNKISAILTEEVEKIEANLPEPLEEISAVPTAWYDNVFNTSTQQYF